MTQYELLKGGSIGDYAGNAIGVSKGDARSLDYSSYSPHDPCGGSWGLLTL